jgi:hypothetical protein
MYVFPVVVGVFCNPRVKNSLDVTYVLVEVVAPGVGVPEHGTGHVAVQEVNCVPDTAVPAAAE